MKTETLPAFIANSFDAGLTDAEVIHEGLLANDYFTRRLAIIANDLERERDAAAAEMDRYSDILEDWEPQDLDKALNKLDGWQDIASDYGLEAPQIDAILCELRDAGVTDYHSLQYHRAQFAAMTEILEENKLLEIAERWARKRLERGEI